MVDHDSFKEQVAQFENDNKTLLALNQSVVEQYRDIEKFLVNLAHEVIRERSLRPSGLLYYFEAYILEHVPATADHEGYVTAMGAGDNFFIQDRFFDQHLGREQAGEITSLDISNPYDARMIYRALTDTSTPD